ncbi:hypothetical protein [uncultured Chitinophaga sp.]|uniref:hypothetical protein n=1 Tax=uncultured Chitinophaga sp. TaxID=339340 RepID=UPI0025FBDF8A|nr:hypothetical protein [uncultured Chitinophaga sp.]
MFKYYAYAALIPAIIVITVTLGYALTLVDIRPGDPRHSYGYDMVGYSTMVVAAFALVTCIAATSIFLNGKIAVRSNPLLSLLCWFLPSLAWLGYMMYEHFSSIYKKTEGLTEDNLFIPLFVLPFAIGHVWSYLRFRKNF